MSDQDNGRPNININLPDGWGGQKVEKVEVDSNRLGPAGERRDIWSRAIELPARLPDILIQALVIVAFSAFATSLARLIPPRLEFIPLVVMAVVIGAFCVVTAWVKYPGLRLFLFYWGCLAICGISAGVIL